MAVVQAPLGGTAQTDDEDQPDATGTLASYLKGGPEGAALALMQQQRGAVGAQQQKLLGMMNQQEGPLSQTGMSDLDRASLMFQAAGALGQTTRSGGFGETLGNLGTSLAGPLSKAAEAQRQRQGQLQQLQLARQKLAVEMAGQQGVPAADMLSLIKSQRDRVAAETEEPEMADITLPNGAKVSGTYKGGKYYDISGKEITSDTMPQTVGSDLTGEDYFTALKQQDPAFAAKVKAVADGRLAMPPTNSRSPDAQRLLQAVTQYDPEGVNDISTGARRRLFTSFTAGPDAEQLKSLNTVMGHIGRLQETGSALNNTRFPDVNSFLNMISQKTGEDAVSRFEIDKKAVADELSRVLKGTATEGEVKRWNQAVNSSMSPKQLNAAVDEAMHLIDGRMQALGYKYESGMNNKYKTNGGLTLLSPEAQKAYDRIKSIASGTAKPAEQQAQPAAAPAAGQPPASSGTTAAQAKQAALRAAMEELARRNAQAGGQ